ncbi:hypothetical protein [Pseudoxanthomonas mexicana]
MLKEVNSAYSALTDGTPFKAKEGTDHTKAKPSSGRSDPPAIEDFLSVLELPPQEKMRLHLSQTLQLEQFLRAYNSRNWPDYFHVGKFVAVIDDSFGMSGETGIAFTDALIGFNDAETGCHDYGYDRGFNGGFEAHGLSISRMGDHCIDLANFSEHGVRAIVSTINLFLESLRDWHRSNGEAGDSKSQLFMSISSYHSGDDYLTWLEMASEAGNCVAHCNLAQAIATYDPARAYHLYQLAALQGDYGAMKRLTDVEFDRFR